MNKVFTLISVTILCSSVWAQDRLLTIEDAVIGQWKELYPTSLKNTQWIPKQNMVSFQDVNKVYSRDLKSNDSTIQATLDEINLALIVANQDSLSHIPYVQWQTTTDFHFYASKGWYNYNTSSKSITSYINIPEKAANKELYYPSKSIAYTIDNNLWVTSSNSQPIAITNDTNPDIVNGQTASRNEFGIEGGIFWSPKGNYIAYYRKDNSNVENYPLVDINAREAKVKNIKYPMAGMNSEHISLGVYQRTNKTTTFIEANDTISEKYLTNITWNPLENEIYIQVLNREQNHMKLNAYAVSSGYMVRTLLEEKHDKYVEPQHPLLFTDDKGSQFIYQSRKDGYNHAYLHSTSGKLINQITSGNWEITHIHGIEKGYLYFSGTKQSPIERHTYKAHLKNSKIYQINKTKGTHQLLPNSNYSFFVDSYSNTETPHKVDIINNKGVVVKNLVTADNPLTDFNMPKMELGSIKAADGSTDLYYRVIKPIDFDPNKKYPAIIYVYGGPHAQLINDRWLGGARMWQYYMAQKGYVVLTVDNRGSANRGLEFENVIHRQCGVKEMQDQMQGVELLNKLGYVDTDRIGVHGWSYGGFMTTSLMVNYPETFKVGVAGGPVIDWKYYEIMYGERYMDTPEENPEGYTVTSLLPKAKNLEGKLLIIHGGMDPVVVWQHSQQFIQECIKNQIPVDYFVYPNAEHNVRGYHRIHLMEKISDYFDDYLK